MGLTYYVIKINHDTTTDKKTYQSSHSATSTLLRLNITLMQGIAEAMKRLTDTMLK